MALTMYANRRLVNIETGISPLQALYCRNTIHLEVQDGVRLYCIAVLGIAIFHGPSSHYASIVQLCLLSACTPIPASMLGLCKVHPPHCSVSQSLQEPHHNPHPSLSHRK